MTGLLVSVRNAEEARAALAGGADLIDVKEPHRGSLGAADPQVWHEVAAVVGSRRPLSVALGELTDAGLIERAGAVPSAAFAKVGLAGCASINWQREWQDVLAALPADVAPVAVLYADRIAADSPDDEEVFAQAARGNVRVLLIDTFDKSGGRLLEQVSPRQVARWIARARSQGMRAVVGGSLSIADLPTVLAWQPDYVAVRGAVCAGARTSHVVADRVRDFKASVRQIQPQSA